MKRYEVIFRRGSWQVIVQTQKGTWKTVRRFEKLEDANFWVTARLKIEEEDHL